MKIARRIALRLVGTALLSAMAVAGDRYREDWRGRKEEKCGEVSTFRDRKRTSFICFYKETIVIWEPRRSVRRSVSCRRAIKASARTFAPSLSAGEVGAEGKTIKTPRSRKCGEEAKSNLI